VTKGRAIILLLLVILLTCTLLSGCIETEGVGQVRHDKPIGEIYGSKTVGQTFVSTQPRLDRIDILLATYARTNTEDIIFHLRSSPNSPNDIVTIIVNAKNISDNQYYSFSFKPISNCKGKTYYFFIESPQSKPGDAITMWYNTEDVYIAGSAYIDHKPIEGDLCFKICHKLNSSDCISYFIGRISQDKSFFMLYCSLMAIVICILIKVLLSERKLKKR
jgi:hypothetical protein